MASRRTAWIQAYAIVRVDRDPSVSERDEPSSGPSIELGGYQITVKEIVLSAEEAMREVERLNALNAGKSCSYHWQGTRFFPDGGSFGSEGTTS